MVGRMATRASPSGRNKEDPGLLRISSQELAKINGRFLEAECRVEQRCPAGRQANDHAAKSGGPGFKITRSHAPRCALPTSLSGGVRRSRRMVGRADSVGLTRPTETGPEGEPNWGLRLVGNARRGLVDDCQYALVLHHAFGPCVVGTVGTNEGGTRRGGRDGRRVRTGDERSRPPTLRRSAGGFGGFFGVSVGRF